LRRTTPEQRAKRQLKALSVTTRKTLKALAKDPDPFRAAAVLDWHDRQVEKIVRPKTKPRPVPPPSEFCWTCEKWHPRYTPQEWSLPVALRCPWAVGVTAVFLIVFAFFDWWALWVFPVAWFVSFSFLWSITIPSFLLLLVIVFLGVTGIRF
jgi:hypothetical protein